MWQDNPRYCRSKYSDEPIQKLFGNRPSSQGPDVLTIDSRLGTLDLQVLKPQDAASAWKGHASKFPQTGLWPILIGAAENAKRFSEIDIAEAETVDEVIKQSEAVDIAKFLSERLVEVLEYEDEGFPEDFSGFDPAQLSIPTNSSELSTAIESIRGEKPDSVGLVLIPCNQPYQVFAVLPFGGWNDCPHDHEHVAVAKYWFEQWGAVPMSIQADIVELYLESPILDPNFARKVAYEMYQYAPDIVDQGTETIQAAAQETLANKVWFFWWD